MPTIDAAKFSECCLELLDCLDPDGLLITKRGKPVAKLIPYGQSNAELVGSLSHKIEVIGEILCTGTDWNAADQS